MTSSLETFAKVRALHDRTTSPGEKAAAAARMKALAAKAGMTVDQAASKLDAPPVTIVASRTVSMSDFFDTPYFREQMAERDRERAERWREVLAEHGSEEAVFAAGSWERALSKACEPFKIGNTGRLRGWCYVTSREDPDPEIVAAIVGAYPMPTTVRQAWAEFMFWDKLGRDREARGSGCGDHAEEVSFRLVLVERLLDTLPASGLKDIQARMSWLEWLNGIGSPCEDKQCTRLATLRADIERMGQRLRDQDAETATNPIKSGQCTTRLEDVQCDRVGKTGAVPGVQDGQKGGARSAHPSPSPGRTGSDYSPDRGKTPVQSGHAKGSASGAYPSRRTNADKRRDVLALLGQGLTDREIARRAGVSPQTVGNIRKSQP